MLTPAQAFPNLTHISQTLTVSAVAGLLCMNLQFDHQQLNVDQSCRYVITQPFT